MEQAAGTSRAVASLVASAIAPVISGIIAPPTIARISKAEPFGVSLPRFSEASAKIVGNMIELHNPTAISEYAATEPVENEEIVARIAAPMAQAASTRPGLAWRRTYAPIKRPSIAPPQ